MTGLSGWTGSQRYEADSGKGFGDSVTMTVGVLYRLDAVPTPATQEIIGGRLTTNTGGVQVGIDDGSTAQGYCFVSGSGDSALALQATYQAGDVGKVFFDVYVVKTLSIRPFRQGIVGTETGVHNLAAAPGGSELILGDATHPPTHVTLIGIAACNATELSDADVLAWYNNVNAQCDLVAAPSGTTDLYKAADAGATWVPRVGSVTLTRVGSALTSETFHPDFA
jgi:hypothetical protein